MTSSHSELAVQRRQTWAFLMKQGEWVRAERPNMVPTPSGGVEEVPPPTILPVQRIALVRGTPGGPEYGGETARTDVGNVAKSRDRFMARHDADLKAGDRVRIQGTLYTIDSAERSDVRMAGKCHTKER